MIGISFNVNEWTVLDWVVSLIYCCCCCCYIGLATLGIWLINIYWIVIIEFIKDLSIYRKSFIDINSYGKYCPLLV